MSYKRSIETKRRLKRLLLKTKRYYGVGAYFDSRKNRIIRYSCHNEWVKTHSRRITRRKLKLTDDVYNGCSYKKLYDYWWEIT